MKQVYLVWILNKLKMYNGLDCTNNNIKRLMRPLTKINAIAVISLNIPTITIKSKTKNE